MRRPPKSFGKYRYAIVKHLEAHADFMPAREIAATLNLPYKAVVDALNSLHGQGRVARRGRKYSAVWGSAKLAAETVAINGWNSLADVWFGVDAKA